MQYALLSEQPWATASHSLLLYTCIKRSCNSQLLTCAPKHSQAYYEAFYNGPVQVEPLAPYMSDVQCPYPKATNGDTSLPTWLYSPQTGKCYYKSSFARGISGNINDATQRCTVSCTARALLCGVCCTTSVLYYCVVRCCTKKWCWWWW